MHQLLRLLIPILLSFSVFEARCTNPESEPAGPTVSFTNDPLSLIFAQVDFESASKVRLVCQRWKRVADSLDPASHPYFITTAKLNVYFGAEPTADFNLAVLMSRSDANKSKILARLVFYTQQLSQVNVRCQRVLNAYAFIARHEADSAISKSFLNMRDEHERKVNNYQQKAIVKSEPTPVVPINSWSAFFMSILDIVRVLTDGG